MTRSALFARLCAFALAALCLAPVAAGAALVVAPGNTTLALVNGAGEPETRAGAHPDRLLQHFKFEDTGGPVERLRDMVVDLPPGLSGDPGAVPRCPRPEFNRLGPACPTESQVGVMKKGDSTFPIYNGEPAPNQVAVFAVTGLGLFPLVLTGAVRPDQGLSLILDGLIDAPEFLSLEEGEIELWGVPADHQEGTSIPRKAFLTMPTRCDAGPLTVRVSLRTWQNPDRWSRDSGNTGRSLTGCGDLGFSPSFDVALGDPRADVPSGVGIDVAFPPSDDPDGRIGAQAKEVSIELPEGMTVSPGGASDLRSCGDAQFGFDSAADPTCPDSSRVGTVELSIPMLGKPVTGAIYLGQERADDRFRLLIAASTKGSVIKLVGSLRTNARTGRLTARIANLPETSFQRLSMRFDGGPSSLLATPLACGPARSTAKLVPYSGGAPVDRAVAVTVATSAGAVCAGTAPAFAPSFSGGATSAAAGHPTTLTTTVRRRDGEQLPERLEIALPPGLSAALGAVDLCPGAVAASGSCPSASRIGSVLAELGPGTDPVRLPGSVYLTGPYREAPFGLALTFRTSLGPFDLGTLIVRGALRLDPLNGQVTVVTDTLPTSFEGISIRFQTIGLDLDRPGLLRNPTSCLPSTVAATVRSATGAVARVSSPFAVRNCIGLPFGVGFAMALTDRGELHRQGKPGLRVAIRPRAGGANLRLADLTLPGLLELDSSGVREICARGAAAKGDCGKLSRVGSASVRTPMLKQPLQGSIFIVQPQGSGSPDIWVSLQGGGISLNLKSDVASEDGQLHTRLERLPDMPLSGLTMRFQAGEHGVFSLDGSLCAGGRPRPLRSKTVSEGQNGARRSAWLQVSAPAKCGADARASKGSFFARVLGG